MHSSNLSLNCSDKDREWVRGRMDTIGEKRLKQIYKASVCRQVAKGYFNLMLHFIVYFIFKILCSLEENNPYDQGLAK